MSQSFLRLCDVAADAAAHLKRADPVLAAIIGALGPLNLRRRLEAAADDHFGALTACLIGQRQAEHDTILQLGVLRQMFDRPFATAPQLLSLPEADLAGILNSFKKAGYLRGLAGAVVDGRLQLDDLDQQSDEVITARLFAMKGIGSWSVEQILFWHLERPDVLVEGDPAVRRAVTGAYGLATFPEGAALAELSASWRPYRSYVAHLLLSSWFGPGISDAWPRTGRPQPPALDRAVMGAIPVATS